MDIILTQISPVVFAFVFAVTKTDASESDQDVSIDLM